MTTVAPLSSECRRRRRVRRMALLDFTDPPGCSRADCSGRGGQAGPRANDRRHRGGGLHSRRDGQAPGGPVGGGRHRPAGRRTGGAPGVSPCPRTLLARFSNLTDTAPGYLVRNPSFAFVGKGRGGASRRGHLPAPQGFVKTFLSRPGEAVGVARQIVPDKGRDPQREADWGLGRIVFRGTVEGHAGNAALTIVFVTSRTSRGTTTSPPSPRPPASRPCPPEAMPSWPGYR